MNEGDFEEVFPPLTAQVATRAAAAATKVGEEKCEERRETEDLDMTGLHARLRAIDCGSRV